MKKSVLYPAHPERICWGCDRYCAAEDLSCGNGTIRTPHPVELLGADWHPDEDALNDQSTASSATTGK